MLQVESLYVYAGDAHVHAVVFRCRLEVARLRGVTHIRIVIPRQSHLAPVSHVNRLVQAYTTHDARCNIYIILVFQKELLLVHAIKLPDIREYHDDVCVCLSSYAFPPFSGYPLQTC
jgi:hypothetical protein